MSKSLSCIVVVMIAGCSNVESPKPDTKADASKPSKLETESQQQPEGKTPTETPGSRLSSLIYAGKECWVVAQLGIYQSPAVLRLKPSRNDPTGKNIQITGEYFYIKHAKKLDLVGSLKNDTKVIQMKESYQNNPTGYFELDLEDPTKGFFKRKKRNVFKEEPVKILHACEYDPEHSKNAPSRMYFNYKHKVGDWAAQITPVPVYDVLDEVWASKLPDGTLVFQINVIKENYHLGRWRGIAKPTQSINTYYHQSKWLDRDCSMFIELNEKKNIIFKDVDCDICCGARAFLDGEYGFRNETIVFTR